MLTLNDIRVHRDGRDILHIDRLTLKADAFTVILGHNGSGKSTLMKLLARQIEPDRGEIQLFGTPLARLSQRDLARHLAYLPQRLPDVAGLSVRELVRLGRYPWRSILQRWQPEDADFVDEAMRQTDIEHYADHMADELSGGERQRAWIAMLLAQQAPLLLLDEPTSALDLAHQYDSMRLLRELNTAGGRGVIVILHDVNLAARYADRIIALKQGRVAFDGAAEAFLSPGLLGDLYGISIELAEHPSQHGRIAVVS